MSRTLLLLLAPLISFSLTLSRQESRRTSSQTFLRLRKISRASFSSDHTCHVDRRNALVFIYTLLRKFSNQLLQATRRAKTRRPRRSQEARVEPFFLPASATSQEHKAACSTPRGRQRNLELVSRGNKPGLPCRIYRDIIHLGQFQ